MLPNLFIVRVTVFGVVCILYGGCAFIFGKKAQIINNIITTFSYETRLINEGDSLPTDDDHYKGDDVENTTDDTTDQRDKADDGSDNRSIMAV